MSFGGRYAPEELGGGEYGPLAQVLLRPLKAAAGAALVVALAALGMLFVRAPAWASLLFEPMSLLFLPGLIAAAVRADSHELTAHAVVKWSLEIYFALFWMVLEARAWGRRRQQRRRRG